MAAGRIDAEDRDERLGHQRSQTASGRLFGGTADGSGIAVPASRPARPAMLPYQLPQLGRQEVVLVVEAHVRVRAKYARQQRGTRAARSDYQERRLRIAAPVPRR